MAAENLLSVTSRKVGILIFSSDRGLISRVAEAAAGEYNLRLVSSPAMVEEALTLHKSSIGVILMDLLSTQQQDIQVVLNSLERVPSIVAICINEDGDVNTLPQFLDISVPYYGLPSQFSTEEGRDVMTTAVQMYLAAERGVHEIEAETPRSSEPQKKSTQKTQAQSEAVVQPSAGQSSVLKIAMIAVAVVIVLVVGIYFLNNRHLTPGEEDGAVQTSHDETAGQQVRDDSGNSIRTQIDVLLVQAKAAVDAGELFAPEDLSAFHYLSLALELDPYNDDTNNAVKEFIRQVMQGVDTGLSEHRLRETSATVEKVRRLQPDDPRFADFDNRLKEQINITIAESKNMAANGDLDQARQMLGEVADVLNIDLNVLLSLHADISEQTKKQGQIEKVISSFSDSMKEKRLISPDKDNAKYYLLTLQTLDPDNEQLQPGFNQLGQELLEHVDAFLAGEELKQAELWLQQARQLGVFRDEVANRSKVLNDAINKKRLATTRRKSEEYINTLLEKIKVQITAGALIEPDNGNARHSLGLLMKVAVDDPRTKKAYSGFHEALIDEIRILLAAGQHQRAESLLAYADAEEFRDQVISLKREMQVARKSPPATKKDASEQSTKLAQEAEIKPIRIKKSVAPDYPPRAVRKNIEGWVHLAFIVDGRGQTSDITVIDAEPKGVFDNAAVSAVSRMTYEIIDKNIKLEDFNYREEIRLRFQLQR